MDNFFGITDIGRVSQNNEDEFIAQKALNPDLIIAAVIDGVGGYHGGEIAAAITRECLIRELSNIKGDIIPILAKTLALANRQIFEEKKQDEALQNMACVLTVVVADVAANQLYYAHVGDTRLYLLRDGSLVKISKDHSFVGFLEDSGRLSEQEAMNHLKRNEINKALGFEEAIEKNDEFIETGQSPFLPGDLLLICSDGLTDMVNKEDITAVLTATSTLKQKGALLVDAANRNGGKDNVTVVLVKNDKAPLQHTATKPVVNHQALPGIKDNPIAPQPQKNVAIEQPVVKNNGSRLWIGILALLCLAFLASTLWLYYTRGGNQVIPVVKTTAIIIKHRNPQEIKLQDTINKLKGNTLTLSLNDFKSPIILSDTLHIQRDSLTIKTKGDIVLISDTGYFGTGIALSAKCRHIVLDSLTFSGFGTAVSAHNNALVLKNDRFINCRQPLIQAFSFKSKKYVNGRLPEDSFTTDSLPKHPKK